MRLRIELVLDGLHPTAQLAWVVLVEQFRSICGEEPQLFVDPAGLDDSLARALEARDALADLERLDGVGDLSADCQFAFVASAGGLHTGLAEHIGRVVIAPTGFPEHLSSQLYWLLVATGRYSQRVKVCAQSVLEAVDLSALDTALADLAPANYRLALISSVFDGDRFLAGFLANMAGLEDYAHCQHLLIRPGSPGQEHELLLAHAARHPGAVYINLPRDPGLYETWNIAATLANSQYLSNANLDDRRHPEQLRLLADLLDQNVRADVASGALRVTETANPDWEEAEDCPVWYGDRDEFDYPVSRLMERHRGGKLVAKNYPHCMPLWRRSLHFLHGFFDEQQYGPSADWEMWLRCGAGGSRFCRTARPLGLYVKHEESYWRRDSSHRRFDERIKLRYADLIDSATAGTWPRSLPWRDLERFRQSGNWLGVLACLKRLHDLPATVQRDPARTRALVEQLTRRWLGVTGLGRGLALQGSGPAMVGMRRLTTLAVVLAADFADSGRIDCRQLARWQAILSDLCGLSDDVGVLVALARLSGMADDGPESEWKLLKRALERDARGFWRSVQQVYRFSRPLQDWIEMAGSVQVVDSEDDAAARKPVHLVYFPSYSNKYQDLLYWQAKQVGADIRGLERLEELSHIRPRGGTLNVVHLHWLNAVFEQSEGEFDAAAAAFLERIVQLKKSGFQLYWTVHNYLIHDSPYPESERRFRYQLARLVDRVYLHHPLLRYELDWLPDDVEPWLCEHGPYVEPVLGGIDRTVARQRLEMDTEGRAFLWFGQMRPYKALDEYLPTMLRVLDKKPSAWLNVAGKVRVPKTRRMLEAAGDRARFINRHVPNIELQHLANAADFGVLTYRHILTSGAMFHMYCMGLPVIAPDLGAMAGYVVSGWNGFLYRGADELQEVMERVCSMDDEEIERFAANARETARKFNWGRVV